MKFTAFLLTILFCLIFSTASFAQKVSVEDLVAKHINSIGTKEKMKSIKDRSLFGHIEFAFKGSSTPVTGNLAIVSSNEKNLWGMELNSNNYPLERFGYNGKEVKISFTVPGRRSDLGAFIYSYQELLKEGLLGGSLTSSWALLDTETRKPKLSFEGTKKISGKDTYVLSYTPKKGSDLSIRMYFDTETYRHVRTEYNRVVGARMGSGIDNSAGQGENRYTLTEDFSDFTDFGGLMLPSKYKLSYSFLNNTAQSTSSAPSREEEWKFNMANFSFNQLSDDSLFSFEAK